MTEHCCPPAAVEIYVELVEFDSIHHVTAQQNDENEKTSSSGFQKTKLGTRLDIIRAKLEFFTWDA